MVKVTTLPDGPHESDVENDVDRPGGGQTGN
jgi:hypothetical protein